MLRIPLQISDLAIEVSKKDKASKIKRSAWVSTQQINCCSNTIYIQINFIIIQTIKSQKSEKYSKFDFEMVDYINEKQHNTNSLFNKKLTNGVMKFWNLSLGDDYAIDISQNIPKSTEVGVISHNPLEFFRNQIMQ